MKARRGLNNLARWAVFTILLWLWGHQAATAAPLEIRVGVLKFGTVNWELETLKHNGLDSANGFRLVSKPFASPRATQVALLGSAVDIIVGDWIWVSRQRAEGADFTFIPYSSAVGALMVPKDSSIRALADIGGAKIGIAGGPLDKSWLLAQAFLKQRGQAKAYQDAVLTFGSPPLLNQLLLRGEMDGVITYWHYAARLQAAGLRRVVGVGELAKALGVQAQVPLLGYIFREDWANAHRRELLGFAAAIRATKQLLAGSAKDWQRLRPLMRAQDDATAALLKAGYLAGTPGRWGDEERRQADRLYKILAEVGGPAFSGGRAGLEPGTFWSAVSY